MRYLSVCAGIEAATVAWHGLGWTPAAFSEIEAFPRALLRHHYPHVPLHGRERRKGECMKEYGAAAGFQTINGDEYGPIGLLAGGTPCQSFSIAGLRKGLADDRGNLALEYLRLADRTRPAWLVWENVPGVLSSHGGRDFGTFLGAMAKLGYGFAYRVLDAEFFGVPQSRRRVFVVGYLGDWRRAAAVLFERQSLSGDTPPRRKARAEFARRAAGAPPARQWPADVAPTLNAHYGSKWGLEDQHALGGAGLFVPVVTNALTAHGGHRNEVGDMARGLVADLFGVRRLTPLECERLQGFPDGYTMVPHRGRPAADGPRYKALGNSMAVPVMRWIGERIAAVDALAMDEAA